MNASLRVVLAAAFCCGMAGALYVSGPPPAHTGGFGEQDCSYCHFENPVNDPAGRLLVRGLPETYVAGQSYSVEIVLLRPKLARGGFQMSARFAGETSRGAQAGILLASSPRIATDSLNGIWYVRQTYEGSLLDAPDSTSWQFQWIAPPDGTLRDEHQTPVLIHVAANAANGDDSEFGDFIYTREVRVRAP